MPSEVAAAVSNRPQILSQTIRNHSLQNHPHHHQPLPVNAEILYLPVYTTSKLCGLRPDPPPSLEAINFPPLSLGIHPKILQATFRPRQLSLLQRLTECFTTTHRNVWIPKRNTGKRAATYTVLPVPANWPLPSQCSPPTSSAPTSQAPTDRFPGQGQQITFEISKGFCHIPRSAVPVLLEGYNIQCLHTYRSPAQSSFSGR